jgi:large subunit ribosomal protein L21
MEDYIMYAVIKTGGKQYKVSLGETVRLEKLSGSKGDRVSFENILMVNDREADIGKPEIKGIPVIGEIIGQGDSKKIRIVKKKRRKNYRKTQGHRQPYTAVRIISIGGTAASGAVTYAASGTITGAASGAISGVASGAITGAASGTVTKTVRKRTTKTTKTAKLKGSK